MFLRKKLFSAFILPLVYAVTPLVADQSPEEAFTYIYENKLWGANEYGEGHSGCGSTVVATEPYRKFLEEFLKTFEITSVVDYGCGDWEFSQTIDWTGIDYLGLDVVKHVIERNQEKFSAPNIHFVNVDGLSTTLPKADLLICKDVLQHLTNEDIAVFLEQIPSFKYCLITNDVNPKTKTSQNTNIPRGGFRWLDLTRPPFNQKGEKVLFYSDGYHLKQLLLIINN